MLVGVASVRACLSAFDCKHEHIGVSRCQSGPVYDINEIYSGKPKLCVERSVYTLCKRRNDLKPVGT